MGVEESYAKVAQAVAAQCLEAGRDPQSVRLVAVSKTVGAAEVAQAIAAGARDFGENRPDPLMEKSQEFPQCRWHFIGNIQSRRIRDIVGRACLIHSLFEEAHATKIDEVAAAQGIVQEVLLEVNVSGEASKGGVAPAQAQALLDHCTALPHVRVRGLMTMAPQGDAEGARAAFRGLRELRDCLATTLDGEDAAAFTELSMGMSEDWPIAIQEGATLVRIGRAIFASC